jgi:preprotein translocase subunit SecF
MASPTLPTTGQKIESDLSLILTSFENQAKILSNKHLQVSGLLVAVLLAALLVLGFVVKHEITGYDKALAAAEQVQAGYQAQLKQMQVEKAQVEQQLKNATAQQQVVTRTVVQRDAQSAQQTQAVQALVTPDDVAKAVKQYYDAQAQITPDQKLAFTPAQVQGAIQDKIKGDTAVSDLKDTTNLYQIEQGKTQALTGELLTVTKTLDKCNDTVAAFEKVAKKSKIRRIFDGVTKVGEIALGAAVGYEIGHL